MMAAKQRADAEERHTSIERTCIVGLLFFACTAIITFCRPASLWTVAPGGYGEDAVNGAMQHNNIRVTHEEQRTRKIEESSAQIARQYGITLHQLDEAQATARRKVEEASLGTGVFPAPPPPPMSEACNVVVEGREGIDDKQQRCCKIRHRLSKRVANGGRELSEQGFEGNEQQGNEPPPMNQSQSTSDPEKQEVACLPSFIIAGTQKCGTTALAAILEQHPYLRMSLRKELHFFDKHERRISPLMLEKYIGQFPRFNISEAGEQRAPFMVGEATPFYVASRGACAAMAKHVPDARVIIMVRDPVKRAYSELQMKVRRVEEQGEIMELLNRDAAKVYSCFVEALSLDGTTSHDRGLEIVRNTPMVVKRVGECAGEVGQHGKWIDALFPFFARIKAELKAKQAFKGSREAEGDPSRLLELFKEDINRCFPLKERVEVAEKQFPRGGWRAKWDTPSINKSKLGLHSKVAPDDRLLRGLPHQDYHTGNQGEGFEEEAMLHWLERESGLPLDNWDTTAELRYDNRTLGWTSAAARTPSQDPAMFWVLDEESRTKTLDYSQDLQEDTRADVGDLSGSRTAPFHDRKTLAGMGFLKNHGASSFYWGEWGQEGERIYDSSCYARLENVQEAHKIMRPEMRVLQECFEKALFQMGGLAAMDSMDASHAAEAMDIALASCISVTTSISSQYLYRGLYAVQAHRCLKHFPREQVLYIENDDLRESPQETMQRVHKFLGVPDFEYSSLEQASIMKELDAMYPDFEKRTGWRLNSEYREEMPADLAEEVRKFYEPHNALFARLVGQDFGTWAIDTANGQQKMQGGDERAWELYQLELKKEIESIKRSRGSPHDRPKQRY